MLTLLLSLAACLKKRGFRFSCDQRYGWGIIWAFLNVVQTAVVHVVAGTVIVACMFSNGNLNIGNADRNDWLRGPMTWVVLCRFGQMRSSNEAVWRCSSASRRRRLPTSTVLWCKTRRTQTFITIVVRCAIELTMLMLQTQLRLNMCIR